MPQNQFFNAHHSPIGSFASFTLGFKGLEAALIWKPGSRPDRIYLSGLQRKDGSGFDTLPFHEHDGEDESKRYDIENPDPKPSKPRILFRLQTGKLSGISS